MAEYNLGRVGLVIKGEYNNTTQYKKLDVVFFNGRTYVAKQDAKGKDPANTAYWQQMVYKGKGYNPKGAWESNTSYTNDGEQIDVVSYNGVSYYCKQTHTNDVSPDTDNENWDVLINIGSADSISVVNADEYYEADTVEGALSEIYEKLRQHKLDYASQFEDLEVELAAHKAEKMPHQFTNLQTGKTYRFGRQVSAEGIPQRIYEEVIE